MAEDNKLKLFFSDESFNLDVDLGRHYYSSDLNFKIQLLRIDVVNTKVDDLYGEAYAEDKKILPGVELTVILNIGDSEQKYFDTTSITREDAEVEFYVYVDELVEKNVEIKRGDYFIYKFQSDVNPVYEVSFANNINFTNTQTFGGYKPYYRKIKGFPVKKDTINVDEYL